MRFLAIVVVDVFPWILGDIAYVGMEQQRKKHSIFRYDEYVSVFSYYIDFWLAYSHPSNNPLRYHFLFAFFLYVHNSLYSFIYIGFIDPQKFKSFIRALGFNPTEAVLNEYLTEVCFYFNFFWFL